MNKITGKILTAATNINADFFFFLCVKWQQLLNVISDEYVVQKKTTIFKIIIKLLLVASM